MMQVRRIVCFVSIVLIIFRRRRHSSIYYRAGELEVASGAPSIPTLFFASQSLPLLFPNNCIFFSRYENGDPLFLAPFAASINQIALLAKKKTDVPVVRRDRPLSVIAHVAKT